MGILEEAIQNGLTIQRVCAVAELDERRFRRWRDLAQAGMYDRRRKDPSVRPYNALRSQEKALIQEAVVRSDWADLSCREISIRLMEEKGVYVSPVAIWSHMKAQGLSGHRGGRRLRGRPRGEKPDTSFLNGPRQLWDWDITKLRTGVRGRFWYLYTVLDQYSRKVVGWLIAERETSDLAQGMWDQALLAEGLGDGPMPASLSDRGSQMRSRSTAEFFRDLGIGQLFARPRMPNDNPFIESLFSTVKTHPEYPGWFATMEEARKYFESFFNWYNTEHLHTRIGMMTPEQKHNGEWVAIQQERDAVKARTLAARRAANLRPAAENKIPKADIS
jgi:transposase InsO family protein